jgi:ATP-dependent helicase/DNAse subunit B
VNQKLFDVFLDKLKNKEEPLLFILPTIDDINKIEIFSLEDKKIKAFPRNILNTFCTLALKILPDLNKKIISLNEKKIIILNLIENNNNINLQELLFLIKDYKLNKNNNFELIHKKIFEDYSIFLKENNLFDHEDIILELYNYLEKLSSDKKLYSSIFIIDEINLSKTEEKIIAMLERHSTNTYTLSEQNKQCNASINNIEILESKTKSLEVENICEKILEIIREKNFAFEDFLIITENKNLYIKDIFEKFNEFKIPFNISKAYNLSSNNFVKYFLNFLKIFFLEGINKNDLIIEFIKSPFSFIDQDLANKIEYEYKINNKIHVFEFIDNYKLEKSAFFKTYIKWCKDTLNFFNLEKISYENYELEYINFNAAIKEFLNILDSLNILANKEIKAEYFLEYFTALCNYVTYDFKINRLNSIEITNLEKSINYYNKKVIIIIGLNFDGFPLLAKTNDFDLDLKISEYRKKKMIFYDLCYLAKDALILSYPTFDESENQISRSNLVDEILKISKKTITNVNDKEVFIKTFDNNKILSSKIKLNKNTFSASQLKEFAICPFRYFSGYILGLNYKEKDYTEGLNNLIRGKILHRCVEEYYKNKNLEIEKIFDAIFADETKKLRLNIYDKKSSFELLFRLKNFVKLEKDFEKFYKVKPKIFEANFSSYTIDDIKIRGKIDRIDTIIENKKEFGLIIDYKTGKINFNEKREDIINGIDLQLPIYLDALYNVFNIEPIGFEFYSLREGKKTGIIRTKYENLLFHNLPNLANYQFITEDEYTELINSAKKYIKEYARRINNNEISPNPCDKKYCRKGNCEYREICGREL